MKNCLAFLMSLALTASAYAGDTAPTDTSSLSDSLAPARYMIQIERLETGVRTLYDTLDITLDSKGHSIAAFGFKVASVHPAVDIIDILPGALIDTCGWDFFKADRVDTRGKLNYPRSLWKAVALSKTTADTSKPTCVAFDSKITIARLVVATPPSVRVTDTLAPLFFYWEDCRDNAVSDASGQSLIFSSKIFDYLPAPPEEHTDIFPTRFGTPNQCIRPDAINRPERGIEFHNGGVLFRSVQPETGLQNKLVEPVDTTRK